jgi:zinc protease
MKKNISLAVVALLLFGSSFSQGKQAEKILPYPIYQKKLANGLNVVSVPYKSPGLAAFYIVVRAGSRDEIEPGKTGFAHFFEHVMFRGTEKYSSHQYSEILKSVGASANANTSLDRTVYHMTGNATKLETMFELEADRFQNLKYSIQDFKTEAGAVKGEYTKNVANPYSQLNEKVAETAFKEHTYAHTTMGYLKDIVDMPNQYEYSLEFFNRFYRPEYSTIIVVGDIEPAKVEALAQKYFGNWKKGNYVSKVLPEPVQTETRFTHIQKTGFPPLLDLNFKSPAYSDSNKEVAALDVLVSMLFSEKSALYKKLVLNEQKVRQLYGNVEMTRDPYLFSISASVVKAEDLQYVKDEIMKVLEAAKTQKQDEALLEETKSRLKYSFIMAMDTPSSIAEVLSQSVWLTADPESINRLYAMYDKVTSDDLLNAAKKYFVTTALTIATISPDAENTVK